MLTRPYRRTSVIYFCPQMKMMSLFCFATFLFPLKKTQTCKQETLLMQLLRLLCVKDLLKEVIEGETSLQGPLSTQHSRLCGSIRGGKSNTGTHAHITTSRSDPIIGAATAAQLLAQTRFGFVGRVRLRHKHSHYEFNETLQREPEVVSTLEEDRWDEPSL